MNRVVSWPEMKGVSRSLSLPVWTWLAGTALALAVAGCSTVSPSQYVSPRVVGRVIDAENRQPIANVEIRRLLSDANPRRGETPHGAPLLQSSGSVRTGKTGEFVMKSVRNFGPLGSSGWYSITLAFEHSGYQTLVRSYTLGSSTNTVAGEPLVETGDVLLTKIRTGER